MIHYIRLVILIEKCLSEEPDWLKSEEYATLLDLSVLSSSPPLGVDY